jgi:hypothetical protein
MHAVLQESIVRRSQDGQLWCVHQKVRPADKNGKVDRPIKTPRWIRASTLKPWKTMHGCAMKYLVTSGTGNPDKQALDTIFYFHDLPGEVEALGEQARVTWLRDYISAGFCDKPAGEQKGLEEGAIVVLRGPALGTVAEITKVTPFRTWIDFAPSQDGTYEVFHRKINKLTGEIISQSKEGTALSLNQATQGAFALAERKLEEAQRQKLTAETNLPEPFVDAPPQIDPVDTHKTAGDLDRRDMEKARLEVLHRKWPRTFKAIEIKAGIQSIRQAYLLDVADLTGNQAFPPETPQFATKVADALRNHIRRTLKQKTVLIDYFIAFHWPKLVYLNNADFAKAVTDATGISVTPAQAKQRRVRLNLGSRSPAGRPISGS